MKNSAKETSYARHTEQEAKMAVKLPSIVSSPESVDCLRHQRMFDAMTTRLVRAFPEASWLTVGDGRFGADSMFLKRAGAKRVHTTSLTDTSLREAKDKGWIDEFSAQNAEALGFEDNSFDFVLCKESYHHFPRPPIAFYEMLRVARLGVVLIEPYRARFSPLGFLKTGFKRLTGRGLVGEYEPSGNYIYRLSVSELYHMARALDLPAMSVIYQNGIHHPKLFRSQNRTPFESAMFYLAVGMQDLLCLTRLMSPGLISCTVFKRNLDKAESQRLRAFGIKIRNLKRNPYLGNSSQ